MIVPDVNLLLYVYDADSPFHERAVAWWEGCLSGTEPVGLPLVVAFGFVRLATHPRVFVRPMTVPEAAGHVRSWRAQPVVRVLEPSTDHVDQVLALLDEIGTAGNLVTDAQIAALAIGYGGVVHTADTDFVRMSGVRWRNPISGATSGRVRSRRRSGTGRPTP